MTDEIDRAETYAAALRIAAKLMAFKALKVRPISQLQAENWLGHAATADQLAEEWEAKGRAYEQAAKTDIQRRPRRTSGGVSPPGENRAGGDPC